MIRKYRWGKSLTTIGGTSFALKLQNPFRFCIGKHYLNRKRRKQLYYLTVGGTVRFDDPTGLVAEGLEDLVVVAVLGELVVAVHSQAGKDLGRYSPPPPLPPLVVLPFLPRRQPTPWSHLHPLSASTMDVSIRRLLVSRSDYHSTNFRTDQHQKPSHFWLYQAEQTFPLHLSAQNPVQDDAVWDGMSMNLTKEMIDQNRFWAPSWWIGVKQANKRGIWENDNVWGRISANS